VNNALGIFLNEIKRTRGQPVELFQANDRILFSDVNSPENLPKFARSSRDGFAIHVESGGDNQEDRSYTILGEARIGTIPNLAVNAGEAVKIATGSYVPRGANAVVMREYSQVTGNVLQKTRSVKIGENIVSSGEDVKKGELLFKAGTRLRPHNIALLSLLGVQKLQVFSKPKVAIFSTGDELKDLAAQRSQKRHKNKAATIFDSNRPFLSSVITELGGVPVDLGIAHDNYSEIRSKMLQGLKSDALILSAGTSVGERDYVSRAAESVKGLRMLIHGVAMRPSSPTGLAVCRGKPIIFLPGFPTSAIVSFIVFGRPAILGLSGRSSTDMPTINALIDENFEGKAGLTHFLRVRVVSNDGSYRAKIVRPTEAQYSSWLHEANGIAIVGTDGRTSLKLGDQVPVFLIGDIGRI
jgi:molybdenum cofactor synthesis domain-containing protein